MEDRVKILEEKVEKLEAIVNMQKEQINVLNLRMKNANIATLVVKEEPVTKSIEEDEPKIAEPVEKVIRPEDYGLKAPNSKANEKMKKDVEGNIGKFMGVIASVLVFISIIFFATMVYSSLTDIIKVLCMFVFSFVVLGIGVFLMKKKTDFFSMSVTGCGMGAIFISLFITHLYFGMINQVVLYLFIAVWAILVWFFFARKIYTFTVIGNIGIVISVIFGAISTADNIESGLVMSMRGQIIFLLGFFVVISLFYLLVSNEKNTIRHFVLIAIDMVAMCTICLVTTMNALLEAQIKFESVSIFVIIASYLLFLLGFYVYNCERHNRVISISYLYVIYVVVTLFVTFAYMYKLAFTPTVNFFVNCLVLLVLFMIHLFRFNKRAEKDYIHIVMTVILYIALLIDTTQFDAFVQIIGVGIYILPMLIIGYFLQDKVTTILSLCTLLFFAQIDDGLLTLKLIVCVITMAMSIYMFVFAKRNYDKVVKMVWYIAIMLTFCACFDKTAKVLEVPSKYAEIYNYMCIAFVNAIACFVGFYKNWMNKEEAEELNNKIMVFITNAVLMLYGMSQLSRPFDAFTKFILLIVVGCTVFANVKRFYVKYKDKPWSGIYTGFKLMIFLWVALDAYEFDGSILSVGWIALSIVLIFVGFRWQYKYLRLFGLFLTMFSIVKLIVFDISYESVLLRAVSFLISGGLCFVINLLYNYYNNMNNDKKNLQ